MTVPGYAIGQAANLAHDYLLAKGLPEGTDFRSAWMERTGLYIDVLQDIERYFSAPNYAPYTAETKEVGGIPVIIDTEDNKS